MTGRNYHLLPRRKVIKRFEEVLTRLNENTWSEESTKTLKESGENGWIAIRTILSLGFLDSITPGLDVANAVVALESVHSGPLDLSLDRRYVRLLNFELLIARQVNFYFSEDNWSHDLFLQNIAEDHEGLVLVTDLLAFRRIEGLLNTHGVSSVSTERELLLTNILKANADEYDVITLSSSPLSCGLRKKTLRAKVVQRAEKLFKTGGFQNMAEEGEDGWTPLTYVIQMSDIGTLCRRSTDAVATAIEKGSLMLEVSTDRSCVRRRIATVTTTSPSLEVPCDTLMDVDMKAVTLSPRTSMTFAILRQASSENMSIDLSDTNDDDVVTNKRASMIPAAVSTSPQYDITVAQYNILAQILIAEDRYDYVVDKRYLQWPYRKRLLEQWFEDCGGDIICLQEVQSHSNPADAENHAEQIKTFMDDKGYNSRHVEKTKREGQKAYFGNHPRPNFGVMTLFRSKCFELISENTIAFSRKLGEICTSPLQQKHYTSGQQVALVLLLRHILSGQLIMVVNTHITCNFQHPDTQTAQVAIMMQEVTKLRNKYTTKGLGSNAGQHCPELIFCGDYNSFPDSGMYRLITEGHLGANHPHANAKEDLGIETVLTSALLQHELALRSAYKTVNGQEPPATTVKGISTVEADGFKGCLDYIFYSPGLFAVDVVSLDMIDEITQEGGGLPNSGSPSDHIPLGAVFRIATIDSPTSLSCVPSSPVETTTAGGATDIAVAKMEFSTAKIVPPAPPAPPVVRPLPVGWEAHMDPATGDIFYYNIASGRTQWDHPESTNNLHQGLSDGSHSVSSSSSSSSTSGDIGMNPSNQLVSSDTRDGVVAVKHLNKEEPAAGSTLTNVTVTIFVGNKILVCLRGVPGPHHGMIFGTGGVRESHESPRVAAVRECYEESGVKFQPSDLSYFNDYYTRRNYVVFANKLPANFGPDNRHKNESLRTVSICGVPTSERQGRGRWVLVDPALVLAQGEDSPFSRMLRVMHTQGLF